MAKSKAKAKSKARKTNGNGHHSEDDGAIQAIASELDDQKSSPSHYEINSYYADYTLEHYATKLKDKKIIVPDFQRKYVWKPAQASKLIESFLQGLPVPPIFLYKEKGDERLFVLDGQQRLRSISYFFEGLFGKEDRTGKRPEFRLEGLGEDNPYSGLTFDELQEKHPNAADRLRESVLRSLVIKQLEGKDDSVVYIFERLNSGGTQLVGQEVRNCVYQGAFSELLNNLNEGEQWRAIFGKQNPDKRMRDTELILRFLALLHNSEKYAKPMKKFLNDFMKEHQNPKSQLLKQFREEFEGTTDAVYSTLSAKPFHLSGGLNAAAFDSVFVAFARHAGKEGVITRKRWTALKKSATFKKLVSASTTDEDSVKKRLAKASSALFSRK